MNQIPITRGSRGFLVHDHRDEPQKHARVRRAAAHPAAQILGYSTVDDPLRGPRGGVTIMIDLFIPAEAFVEADRDAGPLDRDVGDAGGPGDQLIAEAARKVTGLADPVEVARAIAKRHVTKVEDLWPALGCEPGQDVADLRRQIGEALGFVEPPLPAWAKPGMLVELVGMAMNERNIVRRVERLVEGGVTLDGEEDVRAGIFVTAYRPFDIETQRVWALISAAHRLGIAGVEHLAVEALRAKVRAAIDGPSAPAGWEPDRTCDPGEECAICGMRLSAFGVGFPPILRRSEPYGRAHRGCVTGHATADEREVMERVREAHDVPAIVAGKATRYIAAGEAICVPLAEFERMLGEDHLARAILSARAMTEPSAQEQVDAALVRDRLLLGVSPEERPSVGERWRVWEAPPTHETPAGAARARVDAAISAYHGPHLLAFGAALRCMAEHRHPTAHDVDLITTGLSAYEQARAKGMSAQRSGEEASDQIGLMNERVIPGWWFHALAVYERERSR